MTRKLASYSDSIAKAPKSLAALIKSDMRIVGYTNETEADDGYFIYTESAKWCVRGAEDCGTWREDKVSDLIADYKGNVERNPENTDPLLRLTYEQAVELATKFDIMASEPDMLESYEMTEEQARAASDLLASADSDVRTFLIPLPMAVAEAALGEMENVVEIAEANHEHEGSKETGSWLRKARDGVNRIREAIDEVGRVYAPN